MSRAWYAIRRLLNSVSVLQITHTVDALVIRGILWRRAVHRIGERAGVAIDIDLGGVDRPLQWEDMPLANGGFAQGAAGGYRIDGRFHGDGHEKAWGVFDTGAYVGASGAKRQH